MKDKTKLKIALLINVIIIVLEIISGVISYKWNGLGLFEFYTEDSNLYALVTSTIMSIFIVRKLINKKELPKWALSLKYGSTCALTLTFLVVLFILAPAGGAEGFNNMYLKGSMLYHHLLCPLLAIISFCFFEKENRMNKNDVLFAMIPTIIYSTVIIILNILKVITGPYIFLHVYEQPVWASVLWFILILGGSYGICYLLKLNFKER